MMRQLFLLRGLLDTGPVCEPLSVVRDGFVNFYAVRGPSGVVCVDAGWRRVGVARGFGALDLDIGDIKAVFLTHLHWDHAKGMRLYPNAELFIGARERPSLFSTRRDPSRPLTMLTDGQTIAVAGLRVRAIETPGHTAGSVCYVINERFLFTGDTLRLRRGEVVPFWPWLIGDRTTMERSLRRLASIKGIEYILTAHTGAASEVVAAFRRWREPARLEERQP